MSLFPEITSETRTFDFHGFPVRVVCEPDGVEWFVAGDACKALGLETGKGSNITSTLSRLEPDWKSERKIPTAGGPQMKAVITEAGLYDLITRSRKPKAREFRRWVYEEVLPTIRRQGAYALAPDRAPELLTDLDALVEAKVEERVAPMLEVVADMQAAMDKDRKDPLGYTVRFHRHVTCIRHRGLCPCCRVVEIVDANGEFVRAWAVDGSPGRRVAQFDHFHRRDLRDVTQSWLICAACNRRKGHDTDFWVTTALVRFQAYQEDVREMGGMPSNWRPPVSPPTPEQFVLFDGGRH